MVRIVTGIDLFLHPESNVHFHEIVETLGLALAETGCDVAILADGRIPVDETRAIIAVGPHEIYPRFRDLDEDWISASLRRTIAVGTEQPGLPWFDVAAPYQAAAVAALDISRNGAEEQRRRGILSEHLQLGYHPSMDASGMVGTPRDIDVLFLGNLTSRRAEHLGRCAPVLSQWSTDLRITDVDVDQRDPFSGFVGGEKKRRLLASSRILMNIHRATTAYFEWVRALDALSNGTLLVTEHSVDFAPLEPGVHFLSVRTEDLPWALESVLRDPVWLDQMRLAGQAFVRDELPLATAAARLAELAELALRPRSSIVSRSAPLHVPAQHLAEAPAGALAPPSPAVDAANWRERAALKRLSLDFMALRRTIASLAAGSDAPAIEEWTGPTWANATADVTVVVTLYNYARFVREALESVARSVGVSLEVVVVDDASTDGSEAVVRSIMNERPYLPLLLLRHRVNRGLPVSRNLGFSRARAPLVFVLDADNMVYPNGIAHLRDALAGDPEAAFAYGLLHRFDDEGGAGVSGALPWNPARLIQVNYIDAMALVRRKTWEELGGYATDAALHGWEDYDLWLGCAGTGRRVAQVRQFVAKYRSHQTSMLSLTDLETESTYAVLRQRHPKLYRSLEQAS